MDGMGAIAQRARDWGASGLLLGIEFSIFQIYQIAMKVVKISIIVIYVK